MAFEKVLIANNTSVVQDEVLSHRMGLIPLKVDPRLFSYKSEKDEPNEKNTIVFGLNARCERGGQRLTGLLTYAGTQSKRTRTSEEKART